MDQISDTPIPGAHWQERLAAVEREIGDPDVGLRIEMRRLRTRVDQIFWIGLGTFGALLLEALKVILG